MPPDCPHGPPSTRPGKNPPTDPLANYGPVGRWMIAIWAVFGPWLFGTAGALGDAEGLRLAIAALPASVLGLAVAPAFGDSAVWLVGLPGTLGLVLAARWLLDKSAIGLLVLAGLVLCTGLFFGRALMM